MNPSRSGLEALRQRVASTEEPLLWLRLGGPDAFDVLDRAVPSSLFLRDGQAKQSLFLGADARPVADLLIARDDEDYLLGIDGLSLDAVRDHFARAGLSDADAELSDLSSSHQLTSLHGPYAWELMAALVGEDVVGLPYLQHFRARGGWCLRAGKTGEFGYHLLLPREEAAELRTELASADPAFGLTEIGDAELRQAGLENWFFDIRHVGDHDVTPLELQLRWRVRIDKDFIGAEALRARYAAGARRRLTAFVSRTVPIVGEDLVLDGSVVGAVYAAGFSPLLELGFGLALLDLAWAQPWLDALVRSDGSGILTVAPPVLRNRSLYVDPSQHALRTQEQPSFPELLGVEW